MPQAQQLETGTYEIIQGRLQKHAATLRKRINQLNDARKAVFGSVETALIANDHIATENRCIACDIVSIGNTCIFGYNVSLGLRKGIVTNDIFSIYEFRTDNSFHKHAPDLLKDERFEQDLQNLYRYYRNTDFSRFIVQGIYLYMLFKIGKNANEIKAFKWQINDNNTLTYVNDRSHGDIKMPLQHEFTWQHAGRESYRYGKHPHVSILDRVFVETIGGDLTIKIEDNTEDGEGILSEQVENPNQTLDNAEYHYADLGNLIVLRIKPDREDYRYFVYNEKVKEVQKIDAIADAAVLLPDGHGIIFSNGYYLQTGEFKRFDNNLNRLYFLERIQSPNGEDHLYVFYNDEMGEYVLMSYNVIAQTVAIPILCNGFTHFPNGELCYFRTEEQPSKHHVIQIWQTPYTSDAYALASNTDSFLYKVGNKDIVKAMAQGQEILTLLNKEDSYNNLYLDLVKKCTDTIDGFYWINNEQAFNLTEPLSQIKATASAAIEEFEKVQRIKQSTQQSTNQVAQTFEDLMSRIKRVRYDRVEVYVKALADIRALRGEIISTKELRYVDIALIDELEQQAAAQADKLSAACVRFLLREDALQPYLEKVEAQQAAVKELSKVTEANTVEEAIDIIGKELELLIEVVSNLKISDATQTTRIIDGISEIFVRLNQIKAQLKNRRRELMSTEATAEFSAQLKLLDQSIINYLDISNTPAKCDEYLTKLMVNLEELEGKFVEFDEFISKIYEKREELNNVFDSKKTSLTEARNRRAASLQTAANRIFKGIKNKLNNFESITAINGYFASDLLVDKVRNIVQQLLDLEDTVKADDVQSQLKTLKEEAVRQLKDRNELFVGGENVIKFGKHHFSVNTQPLELTIVNQNDKMCFHLTGTNFFEPITDQRFYQTKEVWQQQFVSETTAVYRAEYLAYQFYQLALEKPLQQAVDTIYTRLKVTDDAELLQFIQQYMTPRYSEGYVKGVNDKDALIILKALYQLHTQIDLLRFDADARACASLYWQVFAEKATKQLLNSRIKGMGLILQAFPNTKNYGDLLEQIQAAIEDFLTNTKLFNINLASKAAKYLFLELSRGDTFVISPEAGELYVEFITNIEEKDLEKSYQSSLERLQKKASAKYQIIKSWLQAFVSNKDIYQDYIDETACLLMLNNYKADRVINVNIQQTLSGFSGTHPIVEGGNYQLHFNHFMRKMHHFASVNVPAFEAYTQLKKELSEQYKQQLRLNEFKPKVLSSFVRNQLIDKVYLPLIGDNLAKQIGVVGENKRTDLMGMLLLISPPGYGKTTLMEYIASRLGLIFMKINGPAIGHVVTSLDPAEAPNAAAREELNKLNLAFEMGDNLMLYVDDIQHCNPEFLQKFISLCDGQRKIEGVYKGISKTYDLRGKKVCVVMAGNPYTESGEKFQIPDMLSNRADTYNLGDIIGDTARDFELSYLQNCLTSNAILNRLANKSMNDVLQFIKIAATGEQEGINFEANHTPEEANEYISVLKKLVIVRDVVLRVNLAYIQSAAQEDQYRTEPPFKLQGSYRDMNKLAEKIMPIMNDTELQNLIVTHYENEAQTLTTGAEANLLKFKELNNLLSKEEAMRWQAIKETFARNLLLGGAGEDGIAQIVGQMQSISKGLDGYLHAFVNNLEEIRKMLDK